jgi:hypothetical protein
MKLKYLLVFLLFIVVSTFSSIKAETNSVSISEGANAVKKTVQDISAEVLDEVSSTDNKTKDVELFEDITENFSEYTDKINLFHPEKDLITIKSQIKIKGINRYLTAVFIDGKKIEVRNDGRFYFDYDLLDYGKQVLFITFTTPEYQILNIKRKILKLYSPIDIENYSENRKDYTRFFNTDFLYEPTKQKLAANFTRADLAYFVAKITGQKIEALQTAVFEDVASDFWAAKEIKNVVDNRMMAEFPDGTFRPDEPVKKIEYIITMVRALGCELDQEAQELKYDDVKLGHWTAKFVNAARENKIINDSRNLESNKVLTISDFINFAKNLAQVQKAFADLEDFSFGYEMSEQMEDERILPAISFLQRRKEELFNKRNIEIIEPLAGEVVVSRLISFKGHIFPSEEFTVNKVKVLPNMGGFFRSDFEAHEGVNTFNIQSLEKSVTRSVFVVFPFSDLKNHWVSEIAAKLRYIGVLDNDENFYPKNNLTRGEFAFQLTNAFKLIDEEISLKDIKDIKDVSEENPYYTAIFALVNNGIIKGDKKGLFKPESYISRGEAITAIVRACQNQGLLSKTDYEGDFPFKDISKNHWVRKYVELAYANDLITASKRFNPNNSLTKAEFIVILYKTPPVKNTIKEVFYND